VAGILDSVFTKIQVKLKKGRHTVASIQDYLLFKTTYPGLLGVCLLTTEYRVAMVAARDRWSAAKNTMNARTIIIVP